MDRCPRQAMTHEVGSIIMAHSHYKLGVMPLSGGWMDQSACFVAAMTFMSNLVATHEEIERARH